eukprot:Filipodium_phascolosomae@DN3824_c0_g1_i1.p1
MTAAATTSAATVKNDSGTAAPPPPKAKRAVLGGGCFWGVEHFLRREYLNKGILDTTVGYMGGDRASPNYKDVRTGKTGHAEVVEVIFDPALLSYEELLLFFFRLHDPTTLNRQGPDCGTQYRSVIVALTEEQQAQAHRVIAQLQPLFDSPIVTDVVMAAEAGGGGAIQFWKAEDYHQLYLKGAGDSGGEACSHRLRPPFDLAAAAAGEAIKSK